MIGNEVPYSKNDPEKGSLIPHIQPVRKIHAIRNISIGLFNHERRDLMYTYVRNRRQKVSKRNRPGYQQIEQRPRDDRTTEMVKQELVDYKLNLKNRLSFDRTQIFNK